MVNYIRDKPEKFSELFQMLELDDGLLRMRVADAVEKITRQCPDYLKPYKKTIINKISLIDQQEVRWHMAQIIPRLKLTAKELQQVSDLLINSYLEDKSSIVKTCALQALADLTMQHQQLRVRVLPIIKDSIKTGSAAMKSRGKKLIKLLEG